MDTAGQVLQLIMSGQASSRSEIGRLTGLSRTAVTARVNQLMAAGLVIEDTVSGSTGGRPAAHLAFNAGGGVVLAVSVGRSRAQVAVAGLDGSLLATEPVEASPEEGPGRVLPAVADRLRALLGETGRGDGDVRGVGVSVPGSVDTARSMMVSSIALPSWDDVELAPVLRPGGDVPVLVDKDVNVMAIAEQQGPHRDVRDLLMVKASTGIGVGIVSGGTLQRGGQSAAGELGHIPLRAETGVLCRCGQHDCLEAVAGGWAMVRTLRERGHDVAHVRDVVALALKGDPEALDLIRDSGRRVGEVLSTAVTLLNPEVVAIGGDLSGAYEPFVAGLRETVYQRSTALATRQLRIVASTFGEHQGLVGCAAMITQHITSPGAVDRALAARHDHHR
ncbi:MAG: ROK family transcriptional regulator [Streptosporangiales bacterium]|nr:ROK family transcriptional regulator [Streptosporangiales bacterium]